MRVGKGSLHAFIALCEHASGEANTVIFWGRIRSGSDFIYSFQIQMRPRTRRMAIIRRTSFIPPLGYYPQLLLCDHRGKRPLAPRPESQSVLFQAVSLLAFLLAGSISEDALRPFQGRSGYTDSLAQTSYRCIDRASYCVAGYNQLHSTVFLPARRVVIGGHRQRIAVALGAY